MSLANYPQLEWRGRQALLLAEAEREQLWLYGLDLLWLLTKPRYTMDLPQPSSFMQRGYKPKGPQTKQEITDHISAKIRETLKALEGSEAYGTDEPDGKTDTEYG